MIEREMSSPVVGKIMFTVMFPHRDAGREHIPRVKLHSLMRRQLSDVDVIETIDHLFRCPRCLENYRFVRNAYLAPWTRGNGNGRR